MWAQMFDTLTQSGGDFSGFQRMMECSLFQAVNIGLL